jgi:hypothetical protein
MAGYAKLFSSIITSTIWCESPTVCKVWVTMLAVADRDGVVEGAIPGIAHLARVSVEDASAAIQKFQSPDPYSRTPDHEGRRIEPVNGGWRLLNFDKYRFKMSSEDIRERDRLRKQRQRDRMKEKCPTESGTKCDMLEISAESNKSRKQKAESKKQKAKKGIAAQAPRSLELTTPETDEGSRYQIVVAAIREFWPKDIPFTVTDRDRAALKKMLATYHDLTGEQIGLCIAFRCMSQGANPVEIIATYISTIAAWSTGPRNKYGDPLAETLHGRRLWEYRAAAAKRLGYEAELQRA